MNKEIDIINKASVEENRQFMIQMTSDSNNLATLRSRTSKISDKILSDLIYALKGYKANGIYDPWLMSDGTIVEPLDVLIELQEFRRLLIKQK